ncbi:hypothetical protein J5991_07505, partial [Methanocorpusculum sp.]|nr:hypothetical protein [Methanocorpusculum sp.]
MNAKKIMGAVLVAFLAAALFIGAGAAAPAASLDGKTVFVNQNVSGLEGTWTSGSNIITAVESAPNYGYFTGENIVEGVYVNGTGDNAISITVKYPTAVVSAIAGTSAADAYQIIGNTYYKGNDIQSYTVDSAAEDVDIKSVFLTYPSGKSLNITDFSATYLKGNLTATGDYTISVVFNISKFVTGTLTSEVEAKPVTFKVVEADAITVSASVDQMLIGENFKLTITGQPGTQYVVEYEKGHFDFDVGQKGLIYANVTKFTTQDGFNFTMPNAGKIDVVIYSTSSADETEKVTVKQETKPSNKASVTVKLSTGSISDVKTDAASYFVGDVVKISGTTTAGDINKTLLKITGTNFISNDLVAAFDEYENIDNEFSFELDTKEILNEKTGSQGKLIDVGSYTLTLDTGSAKATVVIVLKQPFVSIIEAPEVVAQGDKAEFIINAEATEAIQWYLFGTNFFNASVEPVKTTVDDTTNQFKFTLDDKFTDNMSAGQYF